MAENFALKDKLAKHLGAEIVEVKSGYAKVKLKIQPHFLNGIDIVHGGIIFTLADYAFALASNTGEETGVAINASINFVKAGLPDDTLYAEIKETSRSKRIGNYTGTVTNLQDQLLASFQSLAYYKTNNFKR
ncbi:MAG: hotdog fold thioesterase [Candidatus Omnitrophica bacterium]|nr:hotdog fold thioesterase [Candidatus Omnitrophota bacterium]